VWRSQQDTQISAERTENIMDYKEQVQVFAQQEAHVRTVNNKTLFTALSAAGITRIIVTFDGHGDSRQIDEMTPYAGDIQIPLPEITIAVSKPQFDHAAHSTEEQALSDACFYRNTSNTHREHSHRVRDNACIAPT
jgi:hypothetical protein